MSKKSFKATASSGLWSSPSKDGLNKRTSLLEGEAFHTLRAQTEEQRKTNKGIIGKEHYVLSNGLKIYLWEKYHKDFDKTFKQSRKIVLLVHGKTFSSRPDFDLQILDYSVMDFLARNGYDVWSTDIHGYGRSEKTDKDWSDTESASNDIGAAVEYISEEKGVDRFRFLAGPGAHKRRDFIQ